MVPSFGTWHDLNQLLAAVSALQGVETNRQPPRRFNVTVADVPGQLVPNYLSAVYPAQLPGVSVQVAVAGTTAVESQVNSSVTVTASTSSSSSSQGGGVSVTLGGVELDGAMAASVNTQFGAVFDGGVMSNLSLYTSFDGTTNSSYNTTVGGSCLAGGGGEWWVSLVGSMSRRACGEEGWRDVL